MNRYVNRLVRYCIRKFDDTGLEQELNQKNSDGHLVVPEIADVCADQQQ